MPHIPASSALSRFRVLDLTRVRAGPTCVRQLADFGADVIKVESPPGTDPNDFIAGARHGYEMQNLQRNKRAMTLNLKEKEGLEIFMKLVDKADVVVENYRPDVKFRLGIDYESLSRRNPRIILASISGFGQDGPYAKRPGFDQIAQGMSGFMSVTGYPDQGPMRAGGAIADVSTGLFGALGVLTALLEREVSGKGQWVQASLLVSNIALIDFQAARYLMKGEVPGQAGNDHPTTTPTSAYRTKDGYINIAAAGEGIWARLCKAVGREDWLAKPEYSKTADRNKNRPALTAELEQALATRTSAEWVELLNDAGVPCGPIYTMDQVFADPHVKHIEAAATMKHPVLGEIKLQNQAVKLSRTPATMARPTPEFGEQTEEILAEIGYSGADVEKLRERKVI